jgi:hypothetical protein
MKSSRMLDARKMFLSEWPLGVAPAVQTRPRAYRELEAASKDFDRKNISARSPEPSSQPALSSRSAIEKREIPEM